MVLTFGTHAPGVLAGGDACVPTPSLPLPVLTFGTHASGVLAGGDACVPTPSLPLPVLTACSAGFLCAKLMPSIRENSLSIFRLLKRLEGRKPKEGKRNHVN